MNAHPARTFSGNRQKAAAEDKAKAEAEFEGRLKERNDGSYEAFAKLGGSERQAVLISESEAYRHADAEARSWGIGGGKARAVNAATTLITGALGGQTELQTAANTLAPYAAAAIGHTFGHGANQNETAQLAGHFLLGATLAYINGGDPLSGGGAAVAAEKAAQYLSQQYHDGKTAIDPQTGEFNPNLLPEHIKEEIKSTTGVIAAIVGATGDGGSALNAQIGGVLGQNAVENNYLSLKDVNDLRAELKRAKTDKEKERIIEKYRKKGEQKARALRESCRSKGDECHLNTIAELRNTNQAAATMVNNGLLLSLDESGRTELSAWGLALDSNLPDLTYHEGQLSGGAKLLDTGVKLSPIAGAALTAGGSKAVQALAGKKVPIVTNSRQPSAVDGEMAGGNKAPIKPKTIDVPTFKTDHKQLGKKLGKHVSDFGGNPSNPRDRKMVIQKINDIGNNYDRIILGTFNGQGVNGERGAVHFRIKGNDVVVTKTDGTFVTILKNGINNTSVKSALGN